MPLETHYKLITCSFPTCTLFRYNQDQIFIDFHFVALVKRRLIIIFILCHSDKDCYVGSFQRFPMFITPEIAGDRVDVGTRIYLHCHEGYFLRCAGSLLCLESGRMEGLGMMCQCDREFLYNYHL